MTAALCFAFVLSGAAALLFETLWFRMAGLALGSTVWASSAVLASFMAGLALGNAFAAQRGERLRRPLRVYAALEGAVALVGLLLVFVFPVLSDRLAPVLASADGWLLVAVRLATAFVLLLVPAAAMGTTLPLLAAALTRAGGRFAVVLGLLYGWNTVGAVAGALAADVLLIPALGLRGTALVAAALNLVAAGVALALDRARHFEPAPVTAAAEQSPRLASRLLLAAFLAGGVLLGLEVVWLRIMQLMVFGSATAFAMMLATILGGIGAGSLFGAAWLRRASAPGALPVVALAAGSLTLVAYVVLDPVALSSIERQAELHTLVVSVLLMLPTSLASGLLFTLIGAALREQVPADARAAGRLTLANTAGAAAGAPVAGLLLLPLLGAEAALFLLALVYGAVAACLLPWRTGIWRLVALPAAVLFAGVAVAFPFGLLEGRFVRATFERYVGPSWHLVAVRESLTETAMLLQEDWGGAPFRNRLLTNHHTMTSSSLSARRYMKLFAYWPLAVHPGAKRALLISYGIGNTGEALVRAPWLERVDVVDISPGILGLSPLVHHGGWGDPLADPRVHVRVEDGRFHLLAGTEPYDIITAEPPPPRGAGVVNLYTREYFSLVLRRLAPGGIVTHWLPVHLVSLGGARAITRAFCDVFEDCTLWAGAGDDWMLVGSNGVRRPTAEAFGRLWREPRTAADLAEIGVEGPSQLAATFLADAPELSQWCAGEPPLTDDRPGRLSEDRQEAERAVFAELISAASAQRFRSSAVVQRYWPTEAQDGLEQAFAEHAVWDRQFHAPLRADALADLWDVLEGSRAEGSRAARALPLLMLGSEGRIVAIASARAAAGDRHPALLYHLGIAALARRDYDVAASLFAQGDAGPDAEYPAPLLQALALGLAGRRDDARVALGVLRPEALPAHARPWLATLAERLATGERSTGATR